MKMVITVCLISAMVFMVKTASIADSEVVFQPANGNGYKRYDIPMMWINAKNYYEGVGGYLATITSEFEHLFALTPISSYSDVWLGGTDAGIEGYWRWITRRALVFH